MPSVQSYKLGPGELTLGTVPLDVSGQILECKVEAAENVKSGDDRHLLNGDVLKGDESASYRFTLSGELVQDLSTNGVVDFTWLNKGLEVPFSFTPSTELGRPVTGVCVPVPITVGGAAKTTPTSPFSFRIIGDPDLEAAGV